MSETEACVVLTTAPSREHAETIARAVLAARLAACVHIHAVDSLYWWDDQLTAGAEQQLTFKTTARNYAALEAEIVGLHPYDTPEIIRLPIQQGLAKYLAWLDRETT